MLNPDLEAAVVIRHADVELAIETPEAAESLYNLFDKPRHDDSSVLPEIRPNEAPSAQ